MSVPPKRSQSKRAVIRSMQSPLNPTRWSLDLSCGHSVWVTSSYRPRGGMQVCPACSGGRK